MFRSLYDAVRTGTPRIEAFAMDYRMFKTVPDNGWWPSARSRTVATFYFPILLVGLALISYSVVHG